MTAQVAFQVSQGFGHVFAAIAETDVAGFVVDGAGKKEHTGLGVIWGGKARLLLD